MYSFIDSHAHLTSDFSQKELAPLLERAKANNVLKIVNVCVDAESLKRGLLLQKEHPEIANSAAVPPQDVLKKGDFDFIKSAAKEGKLCAIGETGLDYHYGADFKEEQQKALRKYFELSSEHDLPVIIHCRDAFADLFKIAKEYKKEKIVLHCFTGSRDEALEALKRNWFISFSGIVTFKSSLALQEVAKIVPLSKMLIETDSPFLAPQKRRGQVNEPSFLPEVAEMIALLKNISVEEAAIATSRNCERLFF